MLPSPLMPVRWQPPSESAAKVRSFAAANGRIVMVFIGIGSLLNEMQFPARLDSRKSTADDADITDGRACSLISDLWLQRRRMTRDVAAGIAPIRVPAGTDIAAVAKIRRIEAQTGDDRESVAGPRVNRDP